MSTTILCTLCRFNKREEDFDSRAEYDNYLEEREDIAFNLIEAIDVAGATERLARYERENADSIVAVAARQVGLVHETQFTVGATA